MLNNKIKMDWEKWGEWLRSFNWEQTREKVSQESQARIVIAGLAGAGKSTLFNRLCGWEVSPAETGLPAEMVEDYGLFNLLNLPHDFGAGGGYDSLRPAAPLNGQEWQNYSFGWEGWANSIPLGALDPLELAASADLLIYILDGAEGVRAADYRWVGRLRRLGRPLLVVLNKVELLEGDPASHQAEVERRLATAVLPLSALTGAGVSDQLLPRLTQLCPHLTVALGRQLGHFRRQAAERLIRQAALINGLIALEPLPLIDLPVQMFTLAGLTLRLAAIYDRPPTEVRRREVIMAVAGGLAGRYGAQQLAKLVPVVGWLVSSGLGWSCTWALGRATMAYFESGGDEAIDRRWQRTQGRLAGFGQGLSRRWRQRPRLQLRWGREMSGELPEKVTPEDDKLEERGENYETNDKEARRP